MSSSERVLIVDDEELVADAMARRLRIAGFEAFSAKNEDDAVATARDCLPNVILMDMHLAGRSGVKAMQKLLDQPETAHIPIIAVSGALAERAAALSAGACRFLLKPFDRESLVRSIRDAIDRHSATRRTVLVNESC